MPVHLSIDAWELPDRGRDGNLNRGNPTRLKIVSRGAEPVALDVINGNIATHSHKRSFEGSWHERWYFESDNLEIENQRLRVLEIVFKGGWGSPRSQ